MFEKLLRSNGNENTQCQINAFFSICTRALFLLVLATEIRFKRLTSHHSGGKKIKLEEIFSHFEHFVSFCYCFFSYIPI